MNEDLIVVKEYLTRNQAVIAQSKLNVFDIPSFIESDDAGGLYPFPNQSGFGRTKLLIRIKDKEKAEKLLRGGD